MSNIYDSAFYEKFNGETPSCIFDWVLNMPPIALVSERGFRRVIKEDEKIMKQVLVILSGGHENHAQVYQTLKTVFRG